MGELMQDGSKPVKPQVEATPQRENFLGSKFQLDTFGTNSGMSTWDEKQKLDNAVGKSTKEGFNKLSESHQQEFTKLCCAAEKKKDALKKTDVFKNAKKKKKKKPPPKKKNFLKKKKKKKKKKK